MTNCHTKTEKDNPPKSIEQCQSCSIGMCRDFAMVAYNGILFYVSYSLRLAFVYALIWLYVIPA